MLSCATIFGRGPVGCCSSARLASRPARLRAVSIDGPAASRRDPVEHDDPRSRLKGGEYDIFDDRPAHAEEGCGLLATERLRIGEAPRLPDGPEHLGGLIL